MIYLKIKRIEENKKKGGHGLDPSSNFIALKNCLAMTKIAKFRTILYISNEYNLSMISYS